MKKIIDIVVSSDAGIPGAEGPDRQNDKSDVAAAIDLDIYEADDLGLDGERFWEAYWRTQHVYGGVSEGQPLRILFRSLGNAIFEKLHDDLTRFADDLVKLDDAEKNDILGMVIFLLCIEKGDPQYDPMEQEGFEASLSYFSSLVKDEYQFRAGQSLSQ